MIYTSGSTGTPKGVMTENQCLMSTFMAWDKLYGLSDTKHNILQMASISFDVFTGDVVRALCSGNKLVICLKEVLLDTGRLYSLICQQKISCAEFVPSVLHNLAKHIYKKSNRLDTFEVLIASSDVLPKALYEDIFSLVTKDCRVFNVYGVTEACVDNTGFLDQTSNTITQDAVPIGHPISNTQIHILDKSQQLVPIGVPGELCIAGAGLARGYLNQPQLTAEKFIYRGIHPETLAFCSDQELENKAKEKEGFVRTRLYRTGDLARWLPDGNIEYLGRTDFQVKIRGFRIELGEIESRLLEHSDIRETVVGVTGEDENKQLVAWVVCHDDDSDVGAEQLRPWLKDTLPEYMVPAFYVPLETLPLTPNGKIDRKALPDPDGELFVHQYVAPSTATEELLAEIWQDLLGQEQVGIHDNFFERGGHSLLVVTMIERMRQQGLEVEVRTLFTNPTIAALSAALDAPPAEKIKVPVNGIPVNGCQQITPSMLPLIALTEAEIGYISSIVPGGAANIQDIYPLSPLQEGILFHHLLEQHGDPYLELSILRFDNRKHVDFFVQAMQAVIDRHDVLRTGILWENLSEPVQVVWREAPLVVIERELDDSDHGDITEYMQDHINPSHHRIDVKQAPLIEINIIKDSSNNSWVMGLLNHHLAIDHISLDIVVQELGAYLQGTFDHLPPSYSFRNYVAHSRLGISRSEHEAFFESMLHDVDAPTAPYGLIDVQGDGSNITEARELIDSTLSTRLRKQAQLLSISPASVFHLAYAHVLARLSGRDDVVFGTMLLGRMQGGEGSERALGLLMNALPIRIKVDNRDITTAVRDTHRNLFELVLHEHAPLVLAQSCSGVDASVPLFSALLNYRHSAEEEITEQDGQIEGIEILKSEERSNYPFGLSIDDLGQDFGLTAQVQLPLDPDRVCTYMATTVEILVSALEVSSNTPLWMLDTLPYEEKQELISWNDTAVDYPKDQTIIDLFREQARQHPNNTAVVFEETQLSYQELDERSNQLARYLLSQEGIKGEHNPLIAICVERSLEMIVGLLGILKAGGAYVPLDPDYPQERLAYMLGDSGARLLLTQSSLEDQLPEYTDTIVHLDTDWTQIERRSKTSPKVSIGAKDLAYVIYTSGSTGTPKGVLVTHSGIPNLVEALTRTLKIKEQSRVLQFSSLSFDASLYEIVTTLCSGACLLLIQRNILASMESLPIFLKDVEITHATIPPSILSAIPINKFHPLNTLVTAGESCPTILMRQWIDRDGVDFINAYGPTEYTVCATVAKYAPSEEASHIGRPIANTQIHILDKSQQLVPIGVPGELCIAGAGLARGYLNQPQLTAEKFIYLGIHPETLAFCSDQELENKAKEKEGFVRTRLYRTGDLARWLPDGNIEYLGRTDFQVKIRGFRIELGEIESRLLEHSDIREAVVGVTGEDENKQLVAWIVCHDDGSDVGAEQLRPWLKDTLPEYMVPAFYVPLETLPLTPNGKIDRKALPAPDGELFVHQYVAPSTATEELLAEIWQDLLGQEQVGIHDNFFERGGHSLIATQLVSRIREHFDIEFPLKGVFEFAQLKEMAASLDSSQYDSALPAIVPMPEGQVIPLSFAQQRLWFIDQLMGGESTVYNMPLALRMQGMVNVEALQASFSDLVSRHDSLRMTFVTAKESDHAEQSGEVILLPAFAPLEHKDLSDLSADQQASMVQEQTTAYLDQAFDLQSDPLFKARLLTLSEDEHVLLVNMHHIISDGWSMGVLIQDLRALYQSRIDDTVSTLSPLAIQYQDYAYWQRQWLSGDILEQQLAYWKQQLQGAPELLELPTDRARPAQQSYRGSTFESRISRDTLDKLNQLSQEQGVTLFMTLLAVFNVLLKRYSGQDDICIGSPIANRHQPGTESQVGFFVNTLVLRSQFEGNETFEALLQQVRETCLDAYSHQDVPFEQLVEELQPIRNMAINPLFQVMFVLQNTPDGGLSEEELGALADIELSTLDQEDAGARSLFDLTLSAAETEEGLFLEWEYNTDIFDPWRIKDMSETFHILITAVQV